MVVFHMIHGTIMAIVYCVDVGTGNPVDLTIYH